VVVMLVPVAARVETVVAIQAAQAQVETAVAVVVRVATVVAVVQDDKFSRQSSVHNQ